MTRSYIYGFLACYLCLGLLVPGTVAGSHLFFWYFYIVLTPGLIAYALGAYFGRKV